MRRRSFIKDTIITSTGLIILPSFSKAGFGAEDALLSELDKNFITPPPSSRPWVFWMWMNGNITKEGITADLEAMNRMGIGGVINFNSAVGIPSGYSLEEFRKNRSFIKKRVVRTRKVVACS